MGTLSARYFRKQIQKGLAADRDQAALQLGFYLASYGMYRGSGFLIRYAYTVHRDLIDVLDAPEFSILWKVEFGAGKRDEELSPIIERVSDAVRHAYQQFADEQESSGATDTLVTKILLGTFGCLPAYDTYFNLGFKVWKQVFADQNASRVEQILQFCREHLQELRKEQTRIQGDSGIRYPLMKLIDMHFFQLGYELSNP